MRLTDFERRGCRIVGVSVDATEASAQLKRDAGLSFPILSDPELRAIDGFGFRHLAGHDGQDIALAASVLLDDDGVVRWTRVARNFRERPLVDEILGRVDAIRAPSS